MLLDSRSLKRVRVTRVDQDEGTSDYLELQGGSVDREEVPYWENNLQVSVPNFRALMAALPA